MRKNLDLRNAVRDLINDPQIRRFAKKEKAGWGRAFRQFGCEMAGAFTKAGGEIADCFDPLTKPKRNKK